VGEVWLIRNYNYWKNWLLLAVAAEESFKKGHELKLKNTK
jgi:hypothetical protein